MRKKELLRILEEREAQIAKLDQYVETQDRLIDGYQSREKSIVDALAQAQAVSERIVAEAEAKAGQIRQAAEQQAVQREESARAESARMVQEAESAVSEYEEAIRRYNAALEAAAMEAAANAERFAAFAKGKRLSPEEIAAGEELLRRAADVGPLPDVKDNPAQLMQNIYRIQQRDIPEEAQERPAPRPWSPGGEDAETEDALDAIGEEIADELGIGQPAGEAEEEAPVQTVSAVLSDNEPEDDGQDVSLDALLDEIIRSGDQKNGEQ